MHTATTTTADGTFTGTADTMPEAIRRAQYAAGTLQVWKCRYGGATAPESMDIAAVKTEFCHRFGIKSATEAITALLAGKVVTTSDGWIFVCKEPYNGGVNVNRS